MTVDVTDVQYQVSKDFDPDKESTWAHPKEKDGWMLAHNALRGEVGDLEAAISAVAKKYNMDCPGWAVEALQKAWVAHESHVHAHHGNEDELFMPFLSTRIKMDNKVEAEHKEILDIMKKIDDMVKALKAGDKLTNIVATMKEYKTMLFPHLEEEEEFGLVLMRAYFTPAEIGPMVQEIVGKGPIVEMGSFIHYETPDKFRKDFMVQEGIPFFVWYIDFKKRLATFQEEFLKPIETMKKGEEPVEVSSTGFFAFFVNIFQTLFPTSRLEK